MKLYRGIILSIQASPVRGEGFDNEFHAGDIG